MPDHGLPPLDAKKHSSTVSTKQAFRSYTPSIKLLKWLSKKMFTFLYRSHKLYALVPACIHQKGKPLRLILYTKQTETFIRIHPDDSNGIFASKNLILQSMKNSGMSLCIQAVTSTAFTCSYTENKMLSIWRILCHFLCRKFFGKLWCNQW